ncbi:MAG: hypothetical protein QNJ16_21885 [Rhodobacter sp.]|nr:hypothetical protein [Rhodobacter sp.]
MSKRFSKRSAPPPPAVANEPDAPVTTSPGGDIPPHVWSLLQEAGEAAAEKLLAILTSPTFSTYAPTAQARLIELAMTRAYGLPVRRSVNVELSSDDADAVAASIAALRGSLPEVAPRVVDVTPTDPTQDGSE